VAKEQIILEGVDKTQKAFGSVQRNLKKVGSSAQKTQQGFSGLQKTLLGVGAALATGAFAKSIISTSMRFEDLRTSLKSVTGSAREGGKAFDFITKFSTETQFSVEDLSTAFIKLKASGIEPTKELLTTFTDTAAITTDQIGTLEAMTDLFSRTVSGGLGLEELNRLADRGVPVFRILEEQLGLTRLQISEFGKTAEGAAAITAALSKGIKEDFGGATQNVLQNLSTKVSNLGIAANNAKDLVGKSGLSGALGDVVTTMTDAIIGNEEFQKSLGKALGTVIGKFNDALLIMGNNMDKVGIAMGAIAAPAIGGALILTINGITKAFKLLTAAMIRNPFGLVLVAVASLIGALSVQNGLGRTLAQVSAVFDHLGEVMSKFRDFIAEKVARSVDFVKEKFFGFVDSLIDAHNFIARIIPGMKQFDHEARGLALTIGGPFGDAYDYAAEKAGSLFDKLKNTDAFKTAAEAGIDLGKIITESGNDYDTAMRKIAEANRMVKEALDYEDRIIRVAKINKIESELTKQKNKEIAAENAKREKKELFIATQMHKKKMEFHKLEAEGIKDFNEQNISALQSYTDGFKAQMAEQKSISEQLGDAGRNAFTGMADTLTNFVMTGKFKFKDFANMVIRDLIRIATQAALTFALKKLAGSFLPFPIPGMAKGGPIGKDQPAIVGEKGPELFVPKSSGNIIPNHKIGDGGAGSTATQQKPVQVVFNVSAIDSNSFQDTLTEQRETIVGIINDAMMDKGRPALA